VKEELYNLPQYYDVAFSWDITSEIKFFRQCFKRYVPFAVKSILEPGCGTGRFLVSLPKYGYNVTGYDNNPKMVAYAKKRILDAGLEDVATVLLKDMRKAKFKTKFDAAINMINTLGYLLSDDDILAHFRNTGESLRSGGIYIIQLACAWDKLKVKEDDRWTIERNGLRVKTIWEIERQDREKKVSYQICKMDIDDQGKHIVLEDHHTLRLWYFADLGSLIHKSGKFKLEAIYDEKHQQIPLTTRISGELGNLYYVLKVL